MAAKQRLLAVGDRKPVVNATSEFAHRNPYITVGLALGAGLFVGFFPALRKIVTVGFAWGLKRFVGGYLRRRIAGG